MPHLCHDDDIFSWTPPFEKVVAHIIRTTTM